MPKSNPKTNKRKLAESADKLKLYEEAVQMPDHEVRFFLQAFAEARDRAAHSLAEDFCGTAAVSCQWVKSDERRTAVGIDTCEQTLQWGRENNLAALNASQQSRVTLLQQDVRDQPPGKFDILAAQNFSFYFFKERKELLDYFRIALERLADDGIMVIDMMGGAECRIEGLSHTQVIREGKDGFKYQWKQVSYNPITSDATCTISFSFPDGSRLNDAFVYRWRIWTIAEVREILREVGFKNTYVYWAVEDDFGADEPGWRRREKAPSDASWTCYLVSLK